MNSNIKIATKARRHKGILKNFIFYTLCLCVLVANFTAVEGYEHERIFI